VIALELKAIQLGISPCCSLLISVLVGDVLHDTLATLSRLPFFWKPTTCKSLYVV